MSGRRIFFDCAEDPTDYELECYLTQDNTICISIENKNQVADGAFIELDLTTATSFISDLMDKINKLE